MFVVDESPGAKIALVTFGSFTNPGRTEPSYAFMNTVLRMKKNRGLVCDAYYFKANGNDWYFNGTEQQPSPDASVQLIQALLAKYDATVFLGNSMGAFGALYFGLRVGADAVVAFSPQTRFDQEYCDRIGESRWREEFKAMRAIRNPDEMAIRSVWPANCETRVRLFAGALNQQDLHYCEELAGLPGAELTKYDESGHDLVHELRATGELELAIYETITSLQ